MTTNETDFGDDHGVFELFQQDRRGNIFFHANVRLLYTQSPVRNVFDFGPFTLLCRMFGITKPEVPRKDEYIFTCPRINTQIMHEQPWNYFDSGPFILGWRMYGNNPEHGGKEGVLQK